MALCRYRTLDISTEEGKQKIIDTFVNAIYVYDDHFKIIYNTNGKEETVTLEELSCSNDISRGEPNKARGNCLGLLFGSLQACSASPARALREQGRTLRSKFAARRRSLRVWR